MNLKDEVNSPMSCKRSTKKMVLEIMGLEYRATGKQLPMYEMMDLIVRKELNDRLKENKNG